jgi:hypothetical protein
MNNETEYMNGGVTSNLVKLAMEGGYKPTPDELLTIAAHDAMSNGVFYTESQLQQQRTAIKWANATDGYEDLYGDLSKIDSRPKRMSAYDRKHSTRA